MASSLSIPLNPPQTLKPQFSIFATIFFSFVFLTSNTITVSSQPHDFEALYDNHCSDHVPRSNLTGIELESSSIAQSLPFSIGYFTGGDSIPGKYSKIPKSATFTIGKRLYATEWRSIYKIHGVLSLTPPFGLRSDRRLREIRFRGPRVPIWRRRSIAFRLLGFWSEPSGRVCMVGTGSSFGFGNAGNFRSLNGVLKLSYSNSVNVTVVDSVVSGRFESVDSEGSVNYFSPVSILGVLDQSPGYVYTLMNKVNESDFIGYNDSMMMNFNLSPLVNSEEGLCPMFGRHKNVLELEYGSTCNSVNCSPVGLSDGSLPDALIYDVVGCSGKNESRLLLGFVKSNYSAAVTFPFNPEATIVAEGAWDERRSQFYAVGCRILNASVGDCSIRLTLRFPGVFTLRNRSVVEGKIWSAKNVNDSGYFDKIGFRSHRTGYWSYLPGLRYKYTVVERVDKLRGSKKKTAKRKGKTYPDGYSLDMRFRLTLTNRKGETANGFLVPLFVGDQLYEHNSFAGSESRVNNNSSSLLNITYMMTLPRHFMVGSDISLAEPELSAEGTYDTETGALCMIGCWRVRSNTKNLTRNESVDCEILLNVQFPGKGVDKVKGIISSMRGKNDPLYFEALKLSSDSILTSQAEESIWRMDFEITMVLISNTCACLFVAMQLFYVKRHPEALPYISFVMVTLLTVGHMVPLLLNFEALFAGTGRSLDRKDDVFLGSGGWLAVNEVIVRVVTMVAFLLELRLLQQTWFSRQQGDGTQKSLWESERKNLFTLLPLYITGGLVSWFLHRPKTSHQTISVSLFDVVRSYSGLVLDGFLLPQIMLNLINDSSEKALAAPFYIGTTMIRVLPHAYDLYRAHSYAWYLDLSYIYANHRKDFYSTFWNIIIPFGGLLFAAIVFLQQRFGGRCLLPNKLRGSSVYEKLAVTNDEELQELSKH